MKSSEARALTNKQLQGPLTDQLLACAYQRISEAARDGKSSVAHPFYGVGFAAAQDVQLAAFQRLRNDGYVVEHRTVPVSNDPRETDYDLVSW